jgi:hypothetical protein
LRLALRNELLVAGSKYWMQSPVFSLAPKRRRHPQEAAAVLSWSGRSSQAISFAADLTRPFALRV